MAEIHPSQIFCGYDLESARAEGAGKLATKLSRSGQWQLAWILSYYDFHKEPIAPTDADLFLSDLNAKELCIYRPNPATGLTILLFLLKTPAHAIRFTRAFISEEPVSDFHLSDSIEVAGLFASRDNHHSIDSYIVTN